MATDVNQDEGMRCSIAASAFATLADGCGLGARWRFASKVVYLSCKLERGECFSKTARKVMRDWYGVAIGSFTYGGCFVPGAFPPKTHIGRYSSIAAGVRCIERNHPYDRPSTSSFFYDPRLGVVDQDALQGFLPLRIGHDVWIGWNAILLPGCRNVGNGAIIGAGAVVTSDVPPYAIVAGSPARVLRHRFSKVTASRVDQTKWYMRPPSELRRTADLFKCAPSEKFFRQFSTEEMDDGEMAGWHG